MLFITAIIIFIALLYMFQISKYRIGWDKIEPVNRKAYTPRVSVVIAMRNEELEVIRLITELKKQIYATDRLEFILVNDHSTDATLKLLQQYAKDNFIIINMPDEEFGKKNAIKKAVDLAKGEIILASDADCSFYPNWVKVMVSYFVYLDIKLVSGPVRFHKHKGVFQSLQALDFASLIGSGAGAIGIDSSIFCNGANMAYRKDIFLEVNNFKNDTSASGDDVFLLHSIKAKYTKAIAFAKDKNAIVTTKSAQSMQTFINQRKRWTAKSSSYKDFASVYVSCLVFFTNLAMVFLFAIQFFSQKYFEFFLLFYIAKFIADLFLLYPVLRFLKRPDLIKWILPFELFYSFYIVLVVVLSFTKSFEWKGRIHKK